MTDIPLRDVQIVWDYAGPKQDAPPLLVMGRLNECGRDVYGNHDDRDYSSSWGACLAEFSEASEFEQLLLLFEKFQELTVCEGIDAKTVHEAFCVIPEYRVSLIWRGLGNSIPEALRDQDGEEEAVARMSEERSHQPQSIDT